jgi:predicted site-specific integrase-resolvase
MDSLSIIIEEINKISFLHKKAIAFNQSQTAELLGVSPSTLENWRKEGIGIEYIKAGNGKRGRILYPKNKIAEYLSRTIKVA